MIYEFEGLRPQIDPSAYIAETATIIGNVIVGKNCYIGPNAVVHAEEQTGPIILCENAALEDAVIVHADKAPCRIGRDVTVGHGAIVHGLELGDYVGIGMGAIVSTGSTVGEHAIVAEGAVVKNGQVVPPCVVVGGTPAKVLRSVSEKDMTYWAKNNAFYVTLGRKCKDPSVFKRID